jgi:hypothetical protein
MRNTPAVPGEGVGNQLDGCPDPSTANHVPAQTAVGPHFVIEKVIAYRVRVVPDRALQPYTSGEPQIFANHPVAAVAAKEAGEGWNLPVIDLTGEAGHG